MSNMTDYLAWRGDLDFSASPFNEVDSLILTQLVYLDFEGIIPDISSTASVSLKKTGEHFFHINQPDVLSASPQLIRDCSDVLKAAMYTRRFGNCRLSKYISEINSKEEYQFSAMKISLTDKSIFLAFSGTDNSLTGWKEDFNMSYLKETPGQRRAVEYLGTVLPPVKKQIRLGGHSKGGNFAVYAAIKSKKSIQNRLLDVYNFDGPGFTEEMVSKEEYQNILPKVHTIIPQSSIIGILLEHEEEYSVIESSERGLMQHRAISWQVQGPEFVHLKQRTRDSIFWDGTLKKWIAGLENRERRNFVDTLFAVLESAGIENTDELNKITWSKFITLMKAVDKLPEEEKEILSYAIKRLTNEVEKGKKRRKNKNW